MNITSATPLMGMAATPLSSAPDAGAGARPREAAGAPEARPAPQSTPFANEKLAALIDEANEKLRGGGNVQFAVHEGSNRVVVRLVDPKSMEVIREFPNTELLDVMAKLQELSGLNVDTVS